MTRQAQQELVMELENEARRLHNEKLEGFKATEYKLKKDHMEVQFSRTLVSCFWFLSLMPDLILTTT